jgi:hypothetical protein
VLVFLSQIAGAQTVVRFVPPENDNDRRHIYTNALLREALEATKKKYGEYLLTPGPKLSPQQSMLRLKDGKDVDVIVSMTSIQLEELFTPVRIPIFKGMIGERLLLVHKKHLPYFTALKPEQLKSVTMVQGLAWPDTKILKANGFNVIGGDIYSSLFALLDSDEPRAFPRAVHEIWEEMDRYPDLTVTPDYYLHYPAALYFFVRKENTALAARLEEGLMQLINNGSLDRLLNVYLGDKLMKAALGRRQQLVLTNPELPPATPLNNPKLWRNPIRN